METTLIIPGLRNSGPEHWQTWFENHLPATRRVEQDDWERPWLPSWAQRVQEHLDAAKAPVWIVAHSFGCLAAIRAGALRPGRILGALLVAPADPDRFGIPHHLLATRTSFPSLVIASSTDPWASPATTQGWAEAWGSRYINIGAAGHINVDSGHGPWPEGLALFEEFRCEARLREQGAAEKAEAA